MESRLIEWAGLFFPMTTVTDRAAYVRSVAASPSPADFAKTMNVDLPAELPSDKEWASLVDWAGDAAQANSRLDRMENALRWLAEEHLPSVSALVGPLLAARLCVEAHGRARLARLPSGTVQILGAEKAFFHHENRCSFTQTRPHLHASVDQPFTPMGAWENCPYAGWENQHRRQNRRL